MAGTQALDGQRAPAFRMDPDAIFIPGHDGGPDSGPAELRAAHKGRYNLEWKPGFIESLDDDGCQETVCLWKDKADGKAWLVDGLQRVLGGREVKRRRKARGDNTPFLIPCLSPVGGLDEVRRFALSLKLNSLRHDDPPIVRAEKAGELYRTCVRNGHTPGDSKKIVADAMGMKVGSIDGFLRIHEASSPLKAALREGKIGETFAARIAELPNEKQPDELQRLIAEGNVTADRAREVVTRHRQTRNGKDADDAKVTPSRSTMRKILARCMDKSSGLDPQVEAFVRWMHGEVGPRAVEKLPALLKEFEQPAPSSDRAAE